MFNHHFMMMSDEDDSAEEMQARASLMTGSISCSDKPNTLILITKVINGDGGRFASCASPNEFCDDVVYSNSDVSRACDRRLRCMPRISPKFLRRCGISSNFVHVEYECVDRKFNTVPYFLS